MTRRTEFSLIVVWAVLLAPGVGLVAGPTWASGAEVGKRDRSGTTGVQEKANGSQGLVFSALTSRFSIEAEGTGLYRGAFRMSLYQHELRRKPRFCNNLHCSGWWLSFVVVWRCLAMVSAQFQHSVSCLRHTWH